MDTDKTKFKKPTHARLSFSSFLGRNLGYFGVVALIVILGYSLFLNFRISDSVEKGSEKIYTELRDLNEIFRKIHGDETRVLEKFSDITEELSYMCNSSIYEEPRRLRELAERYVNNIIQKGSNSLVKPKSDSSNTYPAPNN